ncbi:MAG: M23 family metallopeptidase [Rhodothermaceae bacterium]|nr:M23 family metallopeptidase [Rhodothermaceae bacterium]
MLFSFLSEFTRGFRNTYSIIVMDEKQLQDPRQYRIKSSRVIQFWFLSLFVAGLLGIGGVVLTPIRDYIPTEGTEEMRHKIKEHSLRVAAFQDSLEAQINYATQLRMLMMGHIDSTFIAQAEIDLYQANDRPATRVRGSAEPRTSFSTDHVQPAMPIPRLDTESNIVPVRTFSTGERYVSSIQFPALPPVDGYLTRGFDARSGHYAIDIATEEGSVVRSIGDGYVILADWTHEGGYAIAIQHSDGYVTVYKHAKQLLKRVGDRVRNREAIARSGNSGEITTGPHLHLEIWHNGLAQDPRYFFVGW